MNDSNSKTIDAYSESVDAYARNTVSEASEPVTRWIDSTLAGLSKSSRILEIGSALGRDACYIENFGYKVERTDAAPGFVDILKTQDPTAHILNAITDPIDSGYDLILAIAVFLHFTPKETRRVAQKVFDALNTGGRFAISLKQGEGEEWATKKDIKPRYFHYWSKEDLVKILSGVGYVNIDISVNYLGSQNTIWLMVTAHKP